MLAPVLRYNYLSMGQYLRSYSLLHHTELGNKIKDTIDHGYIIPDSWIRDIFAEAIEQLPQREGVILDGFPRDVGQAPILDEFMSEHGTKSLRAIFIDVDKDDLIARIKSRGESSGRADDDPAIVATRFEEYKEKTYPLKKYFEGKGVLIEINGNQSIETVHKEILQKLGLAT